MLEPQQFGGSIVVVAKQFAYQIGLCFFQGDVIGIATKDVFKLTLEFIDIIILLSSKCEFHLFVLGYTPLLQFSAFVEILTEIVDDAVVVVSVLFPKLAELFLFSFFNIYDGVAHF